MLTILLSHPGELVTREEIQKALWPSGTFVDFENGLNNAVKRLRDALADSSDHPKFIETVPRRGYRFIGSVSCDEESVENTHPAMSADNLQGKFSWPRVPPKHKLVSIAALLAAIALIPAAFLRHNNASLLPVAAHHQLKPVPLVTFGDGDQWLPAFSPDGSRIAYSWSTGEGWYLEVKQLVGEARLRLTKQAAKFPPGPAWSPDGRQIAYARADARDDRGIFVISALGGSERKLRTLSVWRVPQRIVNWSPDGHWIVFADEAPHPVGTEQKSRGPNVLYMISPDILETRQLTNPEGTDFGDSAPSFSPDGATIAFVHTYADSIDQIRTMSIGGGTAKKFSTPGIWTNGLAWASNGKSILFDRSLAGGFSIWSLDLSAGKSHPLQIEASRSNLLEPALWRDRVAFESHEPQGTIGRIPLNGRRWDLPQTPVASTRNEGAGHFSPQGDRIAFISDRTETDELWIANREGTDTFQVTHLGLLLKDLAWHPDGKTLAISSVSGKVFLVNVESASCKVVFKGPAFTDERATTISFSRDGMYLYVLSEPGTGMEYVLWKVPLAGGESIRVMEGFLTNFAESWDGQTLFYSRADSPSTRDTLAIWKRPVQGGPEQRVIPTTGIWEVASDGLYLLTEKSTIELYIPSAKRTRLLAGFGSFSSVRPPLSISSDGRMALIGYQRRNSIEIDMVQGFD